MALVLVPGCPQGLPPLPEPAFTPQGVPIVRVLVAAGPSLRLATSGPYRVLADGHEVDDSARPLGNCEIACQGGLWSLGGRNYRAYRLAVEGIGRSSVRVGGGIYRGRVVFHCDSGTVLAVNHVDVEGYLAGVLGKELYPQWQEQTYQAQAVAARTYALYERATAGNGRPYDLRDDQSSQVYGGIGAETTKSWQAVSSTRGLVLTAGPPGQEKIFRAYYSSTCGGVTNSAYVLSGPPVRQGPLAGGVVCNDCQGSGRYRWPTVTVPKSVIYQAVRKQYPDAAALGGLKTLEVVEQANGRAVWLDLVGNEGRKLRLRADDLRLCLLRDGGGAGLYSMNCRLLDAGEAVAFADGRGFGHGVGMCQWGAEGMAQRGCSREEILATYYPGSKLIKAY